MIHHHFMVEKSIRLIVKSCRSHPNLSQQLFDTDHFLVEMILYLPKSASLIRRQNSIQRRKTKPDITKLVESKIIQNKFITELDLKFSDNPLTERPEHAGTRHTTWEWKANVPGGPPGQYAASRHRFS